MNRYTVKKAEIYVGHGRRQAPLYREPGQILFYRGELT